MKQMIDIMDCPEASEAINAILNNEGIAEVKREYNRKTGRYQIVVVEVRRSLKSAIPDSRG